MQLRDRCGFAVLQEASEEGVAQYMAGVQGLTVLAKEKPCAQPVEALSFLGQWLLDNNPNKVCCVHSRCGFMCVCTCV